MAATSGVTTQPLLPSLGFREYTRAAEAHALAAQRQRASSLDHEVCSQLAQAEAQLLVDLEAALDSGEGGAPGGAEARELLRTPLDAFAKALRGLITGYVGEEEAALKQALMGLGADLDSVHEQEARRARASLAHAKSQFDIRLERTRRAAHCELLQAKDDLRRQCEARVSAAERARAEAEAEAAVAAETHATIDPVEWRREQASLRVRVELLTAELEQTKAEGSASTTRLTEARTSAERQAVLCKRQLAETSDRLEATLRDLADARDRERRANASLAASNDALRDTRSKNGEPPSPRRRPRARALSA